MHGGVQSISSNERILQKQKEDRAPCPLCHLTFRRTYVRQHIALRHQTSNLQSQ